MKKQFSYMAIEPLDREPWVRLPNGEDLSSWDKENEIAYNQASRQMEKALFYRRAFDFLTSNGIEGDYYEFGCHRCRTFRMALTQARLHNLTEMDFFAFDSFEGLPKPESSTCMEQWEQGTLATGESEFLEMVLEHGILVDRVQTIKGFYHDSLTDDLQARLMGSSRRPSLITVDCDLYESAVPVFHFIDPLLQEGTVLYVDDLFAGYKGSPMRGVSRAFADYQRDTAWKFIQHLNVGWWGRSYITYRSIAADESEKL